MSTRPLIPEHVQAKIEADEEHLESRLKQDSAIQQSFRSQLNQMEVALKTAEERLAEMQVSHDKVFYWNLT